MPLCLFKEQQTGNDFGSSVFTVNAMLWLDESALLAPFSAPWTDMVMVTHENQTLAALWNMKPLLFSRRHGNLGYLFWAKYFTIVGTFSVVGHISDWNTGGLDTPWLTFTESSSSLVSYLVLIILHLVTQVSWGQVLFWNCVHVLCEFDFLILHIRRRNRQEHIKYVGVHLWLLIWR